MFIAISAAWPAPAKPPVKVMLNPILTGSAALATGINTMETAIPIDTAIALNDVRKKFFLVLFIVNPPKSFGYA